MLIQTLKKEENNNFLLAQRYYKILSAVNDLKLTKKELELIAFMAIKGTISYKYLKEEFCIEYNSSPYIINNMVSKLKKLGIMYKDNYKIKIIPLLILNFNSSIQLNILLNGQA